MSCPNFFIDRRYKSILFESYLLHHSAGMKLPLEASALYGVTNQIWTFQQRNKTVIWSPIAVFKYSQVSTLQAFHSSDYGSIIINAKVSWKCINSKIPSISVCIRIFDKQQGTMFRSFVPNPQISKFVSLSPNLAFYFLFTVLLLSVESLLKAS